MDHLSALVRVEVLVEVPEEAEALAEALVVDQAEALVEVVAVEDNTHQTKKITNKLKP